MFLLRLSAGLAVLALCASLAMARLGGISDDDMAPLCDSLGNKTACFAEGCDWCTAGAVPSRCVSSGAVQLAPQRI